MYAKKNAVLLCALTNLNILQHDELDEEVSEVMSKIAAAERRGISGIALVLLHSHTNTHTLTHSLAHSLARSLAH